MLCLYDPAVVPGPIPQKSQAHLCLFAHPPTWAAERGGGPGWENLPQSLLTVSGEQVLDVSIWLPATTL